MKKTLCIIPARSGSKTIKNKNIYKFKNKELIYYSIKFSNSLNFVSKTIFSSDSQNYLKIAQKYGSKYNNLRPKSLSNDNSLTISLVRYLLKLEKKKKLEYDFVLILQPTSPFRKYKDFENAYKLLSKKKYDTVLTVSEVDEHPLRMKVFNKKKFISKLFKNFKRIFNTKTKIN